MILRGYYEPNIWVSIQPAVVAFIDKNPDPRYVACSVRVREKPQYTFMQDWPNGSPAKSAPQRNGAGQNSIKPACKKA